MDLESDKFIELELENSLHTVVVTPRHVSIDESCIDADLCSMGKYILYYGELEAALKLEVERKEAALEKLEADLDAKVRAMAAASNNKLTEARVEGAVTTDPDRLILIDSLLKSKRNHNMIRWVMKALDAKKECLITLSYRENQIAKADRYSS